MTHLLAALAGAVAALTGMALVGWWLAAEVVDESDDAGDYGALPVVLNFGMLPADVEWTPPWLQHHRTSRPTEATA